VCVLPTLKREGLPRAVIEGMAYGVTPVVTSAGGSKELVVDGESGLVIEPASAAAISGAVNYLAADPGRNRAMGQAARQRIASHFSVEATVEKTLALYRELIADGRPGGRPAAGAGPVG
jgi:glycosyltransferase involved in cell wall biosynthesis